MNNQDEGGQWSVDQLRRENTLLREEKEYAYAKWRDLAHENERLRQTARENAEVSRAYGREVERLRANVRLIIADEQDQWGLIRTPERLKRRLLDLVAEDRQALEGTDSE